MSDSAFPEIKSNYTEFEDEPNRLCDVYSVGGLTKREYFAGLALQSVLADKDAMKRLNDRGLTVEQDLEFISKASLRIADALLKELSK